MTVFWFWVETVAECDAHLHAISALPLLDRLELSEVADKLLDLRGQYEVGEIAGTELWFYQPRSTDADA